MKILILDFDFEIWSEARSYSYIGCHFLYHEFLNHKYDVDIYVFGKRSNFDKNFEIINSIYERKIDYDFALLAMPHINIDQKFLTVLEKICNKIIFIHYESTIYSKTEVSENPKLKERFKFIKKLSKNYQHINYCLASHRLFNEIGLISHFTPGFIPENYKRLNIAIDLNSTKTLFSNTIYNDHRNTYKNMVQKKLEAYNIEMFLPKDDQMLTRKYERFMWIQLNGFFPKDDLFILSKKIISLRGEIWYKYMSHMAQSCAIFSLPSYFKGIPGRVIEASILGLRSYIFIENQEIEFIKKLYNSELVNFINLDDFLNIEKSQLLNNSCKLNSADEYFHYPVKFIESLVK